MPVKLKNTLAAPSRLSDRIKSVLKNAIIDGQLEPGEKLPTEVQIATELSVSKVTVREALRDLESEGLIEKRRGVRGGSYVAEPSWARISELVGDYIQFGSLTPGHLTEFRRILEPSLVALAAERRSDRDLEALRACIGEFEQSLDRGQIDHPQGIAFHRLIADACHNPLISAVMAAILDVFEDIIAAVPMSVEDGRVDLDFCRRLHACLVDRDRGEAARLMKDHFDVLSDIIKRYRPR